MAPDEETFFYILKGSVQIEIVAERMQKHDRIIKKKLSEVTLCRDKFMTLRVIKVISLSTDRKLFLMVQRSTSSHFHCENCHVFGCSFQCGSTINKLQSTKR